MKKHARSKKRVLRMALVAAASVLWLALRTGRKPSRIAYPCQRAAVANVHVFLLALFALSLDFRRSKASLSAITNRRVIKTVLLLSLLFVAFESVPLTGTYTPPAGNSVSVPLDLRSHNAIALIGSSNLFFVENATGVDGNMDGALSALLRLMENHGLLFFKTAGNPTGLIGRDDVVLIKVNCQWPERGGTNTDLIKSIITTIVNHPEGFTGEIVVADNGQGRGSLDWTESNAFNHSQSVKDVVEMFPSHRISTWLWDAIRSRNVNEYSQGDFNDGYVVNSTQDPITHLRVSYPKFKTKYDTYISFKNGIWNNATGSYNSEKLKVINVPVLKSHSSYGVTACVKHYMGVVSQDLTNTHSAIQYGAMGTEMAETRFPTLNILDAIWVNANPREGSNCGPSTSYEIASLTGVIGASLDPVALDYWASKYILIPAAIHKGYTAYSSLNPDYEPITPGLTESYHNYLERSMNQLKNAGFQATLNETEMNVYVSPTMGAVRNLDTGLSYASLQAAIDADETLDGHTIHVNAGTYIEHVNVNKSVSIFGENWTNTIIRGQAYPDLVVSVFYVTANNVTISSFTIRDGLYGIQTRANYTQITNCTISNNVDGIVSAYSHGGNIITGNIIKDNTVFGISLDTSSDVISKNTMTNNEIGILLQGKIPPPSGRTSGCIVAENNITHNNVGCNLYETDNNTLYNNYIANNNIGCQPYFSNNNSISHNNFVNNRVHASSPNCTNTWDYGYPSGGNYWSDHNPPDQNKDKIGDIPYSVDENNTDKYPLIYPCEFYKSGCVPKPDLNKDGIVNIIDIATAAKAFRSVPGDAKWNPLADMDMNEIINILDISAVARKFDKET